MWRLVLSLVLIAALWLPAPALHAQTAEPPPELASRCYRVVNNLMLLLVHAGIRPKQETADNLMAWCRQAASDYGELGVECFGWAWSEGIYFAILTRGESLRTVQGRYLACVGAR